MSTRPQSLSAASIPLFSPNPPGFEMLQMFQLLPNEFIPITPSTSFHSCPPVDCDLVLASNVSELQPHSLPPQSFYSGHLTRGEFPAKQNGYYPNPTPTPPVTVFSPQIGSLSGRSHLGFIPYHDPNPQQAYHNQLHVLAPIQQLPQSYLPFQPSEFIHIPQPVIFSQNFSSQPQLHIQNCHPPSVSSNAAPLQPRLASDNTSTSSTQTIYLSPPSTRATE
jgi:hypothetical protein